MITLSDNANKEMKKIRASMAVEILRSVTETIRELKRVPAGTIYASLMQAGCSLSQYEQIESIIIGSGVVRKENNELIWNA